MIDAVVYRPRSMNDRRLAEVLVRHVPRGEGDVATWNKLIIPLLLGRREQRQREMA